MAEQTRTSIRKQLLVGVIALTVGLGLGFALPSSWLFVQHDAPSDAPADPHGHKHADDDVQYACPMFCVLMDTLPDDKKCPVCGMKMTKVSGRNTLTPQERRMAGVEVGTIRRLRLARTVRVVGEVDFDETRLSRVTTRVAGWLQQVAADTTWARVTKGQELAKIYAPDLYAAQKEYLVAYRETQRRKQEGGAGAARDGASMLRAARRRLELFGIAAPEIAQLEETGVVEDSLVLRAPREGVIVERRAVSGSAVKTGATLYTIADLSRVWVQAEVFERDLPWIMTGQTARLRIDGDTETFTGRVAFIDPVLSRTTRTARVRIEVENPSVRDGTRRLRIGQRIDVWIESELGADGRPLSPDAEKGVPPTLLAVPRSAVLSTGNRYVLYLLFEESMGKRDYAIDAQDLPKTVFYELIPVRVGLPVRIVGDSSGEGFYPILGIARSATEKPDKDSIKRLREGLAVVLKGNLLIDSQAQLSGKPSLLFPKGNRGQAGDPHAGH